MSSDVQYLKSQVRLHEKRIDELMRRDRPRPARDPQPLDPGVAFRVVSYTEPAAAGRVLSATCVPTNGQGDGVDETRVIIHHRVTVDEVVWAVPLAEPYIEDPGGSGSGESVVAFRWIQVAPTPGALLAKTVCEGPHGEQQLDPPSVWCRVQQITAGCDHSEAWTLADAPDILDPCAGSGEGGSTMPHILEGVNLGDHVDPSEIQPGKLVLLTPLSVISSPHRPRYAIEYIDPTDNGQECTDSSSSSGSSGSSGSGSSGSGGSSGSNGSGGSGSDKSTAIVPVKWSPTGYAALFTLEAPDVRFDDVQVVQTRGRVTRVAIDPKFVSVCEVGSIDAVGVTADRPVRVGVSIEAGNTLVIRRPWWSWWSGGNVRVVVRLSGIRRGFAGKRFPFRTAAQFAANERFLNSAYPGAGRA